MSDEELYSKVRECLYHGCEDEAKQWCSQIEDSGIQVNASQTIQEYTGGSYE
jgi:hypothetical protein